MSNETMPVEIWAEPVESGKVRGQWTKSLWTDRDVPYTRTDTIPSKAEVAREFFETADKLAGQKMQRTGVIAGAHYAAAFKGVGR